MHLRLNRRSLAYQSVLFCYTLWNKSTFNLTKLYRFLGNTRFFLSHTGSSAERPVGIVTNRLSVGDLHYVALVKHYVSPSKDCIVLVRTCALNQRPSTVELNASSRWWTREASVNKVWRTASRNRAVRSEKVLSFLSVRFVTAIVKITSFSVPYFVLSSLRNSGNYGFIYFHAACRVEYSFIPPRVIQPIGFRFHSWRVRSPSRWETTGVVVCSRSTIIVLWLFTIIRSRKPSLPLCFFELKTITVRRLHFWRSKYIFW